MVLGVASVLVQRLDAWNRQGRVVCLRTCAVKAWRKGLMSVSVSRTPSCSLYRRQLMECGHQATGDSAVLAAWATA